MVAAATNRQIDLPHRKAPDAPSEIGGKAAALAQLERLGIDVPPWIALPARTFDGLAPEAPLPPDLREEVRRALEAAGLAGTLLAVRSSAAEEDGAGASFAGQFESVLGVPGEGEALWEAIRRVRASSAGERAEAYRRERGQSVASPQMAVLLQEMVAASASGVAFSTDPVTGDPETVLLTAVYGLAEDLVRGEVEGDTCRVSLRDGRVRQEPARKETAVRLNAAGGVRREPVPSLLQEDTVLTDAECLELARLVRRIAEGCQAPQDVEWVLAERRFRIVQSRPITTPLPLAPLPDEGGRRVWDNSNIIESYHGVTTPLTFSFARGVYEEVYLQFCGLMGVSEALLREHRPVFRNMIGLVRGRIYYNLLNWYAALSLLPGYSFNRAFMERMMGVREKLAAPPEPPYTAGRGEDLLRLVRMSARMLRERRRLPDEARRFRERLHEILGPLESETFAGWPPSRLAALYRRLERELLEQWRAPLVNDFFAMIETGLLARLVERWLPDLPPTLANDLLCGEGGIVSAEPGRRVVELAAQVAAGPELFSLFREEPDERRLWERIRAAQVESVASFRRGIEEYLNRFGERCPNELKLESITHREDPSLLLRTIRAQVDVPDGNTVRGAETAIRARAEAEVRERLRGPRRALFMAVLRGARARVRDRENLRFERTRVFGLVRRIFLALGDRLAASGRLAAPRDIFYLTCEEVFGCLEGTGSTADLRALVALRREEFARWEREPAPPDRFETYGPPSDAPVGETHPVEEAGKILQGKGCCPGVVRAPVRVVKDPREAGDLRGRIIVAERTDPGWTILFPAAAGLLVQRGSLLSHSAIVARETGLPCIVSVPHLLQTLRDGEWVEMDGATGEIRRLEADD